MMLYHTVYSSLAEIPLPCRPLLEELLSREYPSLQWLEERDRLDGLRAHYYLFFKEGSDRPVGFLRPMVRELVSSTKTSFFHRLISPPARQKWLNIQSPGADGHGLIFDPLIEHELIPKVLHLIVEKTKSDYDLIQLTVQGHLSFDFPFRAVTTEWKKNNILIKQYDDYESYRLSIPDILRNKIELEEKVFTSQSHYEIISAESFSDLFRQNELSKTVFSNHRHPFLTYARKTRGHFWALFYEGRLLTLSVLTLGKGGQAFGDMAFNLDFEINSSFARLMFQKLIQKFYQLEGSKALRLLGILNWPGKLQGDLASFGLTPCHNKTYVIPVTGKKKRGRWKKKGPYHESPSIL
ncbi:MAG: hypothetical protein OXB88_05290 [Bacteriovoracales bacterium]|nr:hypothetical protein [Bacteriovoracales bacterium]